MPHPERIHTENFVCFCSRSVELQMRENGIFFTPVKYTLVCRVPWVSWAARHTTVCLDHRCPVQWCKLNLHFLCLLHWKSNWCVIHVIGLIGHLTLIEHIVFFQLSGDCFIIECLSELSNQIFLALFLYHSFWSFRNLYFLGLCLLTCRYFCNNAMVKSRWRVYEKGSWSQWYICTLF